MYKVKFSLMTQKAMIEIAVDVSCAVCYKKIILSCSFKVSKF